MRIAFGAHYNLKHAENPNKRSEYDTYSFRDINAAMKDVNKVISALQNGPRDMFVITAHKAELIEAGVHQDLVREGRIYENKGSKVDTILTDGDALKFHNEYQLFKNAGFGESYLDSVQADPTAKTLYIGNPGKIDSEFDL